MDELRRVWDAAGDMGYPFGPMYRLLILTGQRRSEVAELELPWIDVEHRAVEIPASRYKTKRAHVYPLSAPAWAIIEALPRWNDGDCLISTTSGARPVSGFSKAKQSLDDKRSEEHTSELQSLMRISYAVFCLKKKNAQHTTTLKYLHVQLI